MQIKILQVWLMPNISIHAMTYCLQYNHTAHCPLSGIHPYTLLQQTVLPYLQNRLLLRTHTHTHMYSFTLIFSLRRFHFMQVTTLSPWRKDGLRKLKVHRSRNSLHFMISESSLSCLQEPANYLHLQPDKSSP
jgi:hypothetical protein